MALPAAWPPTPALQVAVAAVDLERIGDILIPGAGRGPGRLAPLRQRGYAASLASSSTRGTSLHRSSSR